MTERVREGIGKWLPMVIQIGAMLISLAAFTEHIRASVDSLSRASEGQGRQLNELVAAVNDLKESNAVAKTVVSTQAIEIGDLKASIRTMEQRLNQLGERLARKGI